MKNYRPIFFFVFVLMYALGIAIGSVCQIKANGQEEMYSYLSGAVSEYDTGTGDAVRKTVRDNAVLLAGLCIAGFFKAGPAIIAGVTLLKGYASGFATVAALRLYGIKGLVICFTNIFSGAILIPSLAFFAAEAFKNVLEKGSSKKRYCLLTFLLGAVMLAEALLRGLLSPMFIEILGKLE